MLLKKTAVFTSLGECDIILCTYIKSVTDTNNHKQWLYSYFLRKTLYSITRNSRMRLRHVSTNLGCVLEIMLHQFRLLLDRRSSAYKEKQASQLLYSLSVSLGVSLSRFSEEEEITAAGTCQGETLPILPVVPPFTEWHRRLIRMSRIGKQEHGLLRGLMAKLKLLQHRQVTNPDSLTRSSLRSIKPGGEMGRGWREAQVGKALGKHRERSKAWAQPGVIQPLNIPLTLPPPHTTHSHILRGPKTEPI